MTKRPRTVALKQAAAAVGQTTLMRAYERAFEKHGLHVAQLLLTHEDFEKRERYVNAQNTLTTLLSRGIVPIINENDTVATEEIRLEGDERGANDHLAALVTQMIGADLLILLTDSDGLFTKDPHRHPDARRIPLVENPDDESIRDAIGLGTSSAGTGGMSSKIHAARVLSASGIPVVIASGLARRPILDALDGKGRGHADPAPEHGKAVDPQDVDRLRAALPWDDPGRRRGEESVAGGRKEPPPRRGDRGARRLRPGRGGVHRGPAGARVRPGDRAVEQRAGGAWQGKAERRGPPHPGRRNAGRGGAPGRPDDPPLHGIPRAEERGRMTMNDAGTTETMVVSICRAAKSAAPALAGAGTEAKNAALRAMSEGLLSRAGFIKEENAEGPGGGESRAGCPRRCSTGCS